MSLYEEDQVPKSMKSQLFKFEKELLNAEFVFKETKVDYDFILKQDEFRKNRFCDAMKVIGNDK